MTKFFSITIAIATLVIVFTSCKRKMHKTPGGLEYKIINDKQGDKIASGDLVYFKLVASTKDTVIMRSMDNPEGYYRVLVHEPILPGNFDEGLTMLSAGDSALFRINSDTFYTNYFHMPVPKFIKPGAIIDFNIMVDSVISKKVMDERKLVREKQMKEDEENENKLIDEYLKANGDNFTKTTSGLYYHISKTTHGAQAKSGDMVSANYTGKLLNGKEFDSNAKTGAPYEFPVGQHQVIAGWDEAFMMLHEGEKAVLVIPSSLGYGPQGNGPDIPPYSPLVFDVELVKIKPAKK